MLHRNAIDGLRSAAVKQGRGVVGLTPRSKDTSCPSCVAGVPRPEVGARTREGQARDEKELRHAKLQRHDDAHDRLLGDAAEIGPTERDGDEIPDGDADQHATFGRNPRVNLITKRSPALAPPR